MAAQVTQIGMTLATPCPLDSSVTTGGSQNPGIRVTFGGNTGATWAMYFYIDPYCGRTMDHNIVISSCPGLEVTMALVGSAGYSDWHHWVAG